jgi:crossover junction endodeoxyribonuclease RusA
MTVTLFVPGEIWSLNAERSMHHHKRAALVAPMRQAAMIVTRNVMRHPSTYAFTVPVVVTFRPFQKNRGPAADTANHLPACKAVLDGCVDAGLIFDDTPEYVVMQSFLPPVRVSASHTGIEIVLAPAGEGF